MMIKIIYLCAILFTSPAFSQEINVISLPDGNKLKSHDLALDVHLDVGGGGDASFISLPDGNKLGTHGTSLDVYCVNGCGGGGGSVNSVSVTSPIRDTGTATDPIIGITKSDTSTNGYLSFADWNTFNSKENTLTFSPPLSRSTNTISIPAATNSVNGYLTSSDWTTFNSKEPAISSGTTLQYWRGDKSFQTLNTSVVPEGSNLYYTTARFDSALATKTTSNLSEGSNLYYTNARADTEFDIRLATKTTTDLAEGLNLYYTSARTQATAKAGTSSLLFYVSKDAGNDSNECSILLPCKTIQAGINAANAVAAYYKQAIVYISPNNGSAGYGENITLSQQGVNLMCDNSVQNSRACTLAGTVTVNLTGTSGGANFIAASNEVYINGLVVSSGASTAITFSGTTFQRLALINSYIQSSSATAISVTNSGVNGIPSTLAAYDTTYENNSSTNPTVSVTNGRFWNFGTQPTIQNDNAAGPSIIQSGSSNIICNLCTITGQVQITSNTASTTFNLSTISSGTNSCIDTPSSPNTGVIIFAYAGCTSTNTNSITGSGVVALFPGNVRLSSSGDIASTVTQAVFPSFPQGEIQLGTGAVTGTNVLLSIKGGHIKATQTTAPTATVNAHAGTGATCTLSNASDVAGTINLTTTATSPASGEQCKVNFNKAYGVAPICTLTPSNGNAATQAVVNGTSVASTTAILQLNYANADATGHSNTWTYHCVETQ